MLPLGPLAAFSSSITWAYASAHYARTSRTVSSVEVNVARATTVLPIYLILCFAIAGRHAFSDLTLHGASWLLVSVLCSYVFADNLFFIAARRVGISTALTIASTYPLWAALYGVVLGGEKFGLGRAGGTLLCLGGVIALVQLSHSEKTHVRDRIGLLLAFATSVLWSGNTISTKYGSVGLSVLEANAVRYVFSFVLLSGAVRFVAKSAVPRRKWWVALLPAILADAFLGSILYVYGLGHSDLAVGATLSSLAPLVSVPVAIALGEERWNPARFVAVCATVLGVAILILGG